MNLQVCCFSLHFPYVDNNAIFQFVNAIHLCSKCNFSNHRPGRIKYFPIDFWKCAICYAGFLQKFVSISKRFDWSKERILLTNNDIVNKVGKGASIVLNIHEQYFLALCTCPWLHKVLVPVSSPLAGAARLSQLLWDLGERYSCFNQLRRGYVCAAMSSDLASLMNLIQITAQSYAL